MPRGVYTIKGTRFPKLERDAAAAERPVEHVDAVRYIYSAGVRYRVHSADSAVNTNGEFPGRRGDWYRAPAQINQYSRNRAKGQVAE